MNKDVFVNKILKYNHDKVACINANNETLTYRDLHQRVDQIEEFFSKNSQLRYKRYGLIIEDAFSLFPLVLGCLENIVSVPIDSDLPIEQIKQIMIDYRLSGLIYTNRQFEECEGTLIQLDWYSEIKLKRFVRDDYPIERDLAFIVSTTGTTQEAKRVLIEHSAYMRQVLHEAEWFNFDDSVAHIISSKPSRYVSTFIGFRVLWAGGIIYMCSKFNPKQIVQWIQQVKKINCSMTPSGLLPLIEEANRIQLDKTGLELNVFLSGSSVTPSLVEHFKEVFNANIVYNYGSSETGALATSYLQSNLKEHSVGRLMIDRSEIRIVNQELQIKTNNLFKGYDQYEDVKTADGWYPTGDLGILYEDDSLEIIGRIKELINRGGDKISPFELEKKLSNHPNVIDCVVFPVNNPKGYDDIACAVVLKPNTTLSLQECRAFLRQWFIAYHCPTRLIHVQSIPTNENTKVTRNLLQDHFKHVLVEELLEQDEDDSLILRLAKQHLNLNELELQDNFFDCGGDSLKASELISHIEHLVQKRIDLTQFMKTGILQDLNHFMDEETHFLVRLKNEGNKIPLLCLHSGDGDAMNYRFIAQQFSDRPVYAFKYKHNEAQLFPFETMEEMVSAYIKELDHMGPYHILGDCLGGGIAYEMARQMHEKGYQVKTLFLLDTPRKGIPKIEYSLTNRLILKISRNIRMILHQPTEIITELKKSIIKMKEWFDFRNNPDHFRRRIYQLYRNYRAMFYPGNMVYIKSKDEQDETHFDYWKNKVNHIKNITLDARHGEFISYKHCSELVKILEQEFMLYE